MDWQAAFNVTPSGTGFNTPAMTPFTRAPLPELSDLPTWKGACFEQALAGPDSPMLLDFPDITDGESDDLPYLTEERLLRTASGGSVESARTDAALRPAALSHPQQGPGHAPNGACGTTLLPIPPQLAKPRVDREESEPWFDAWDHCLETPPASCPTEEALSNFEAIAAHSVQMEKTFGPYSRQVADSKLLLATQYRVAGGEQYEKLAMDTLARAWQLKRGCPQPKPQKAATCTGEFVHLQKRIRTLMQRTDDTAGPQASHRGPIPYDGECVVPTAPGTNAFEAVRSREIAPCASNYITHDDEKPRAPHNTALPSHCLSSSVSNTSVTSSTLSSSDIRCGPLELRYPQRRRCAVRVKVPVGVAAQDETESQGAWAPSREVSRESLQARTSDSAERPPEIAVKAEHLIEPFGTTTLLSSGQRLAPQGERTSEPGASAQIIGAASDKPACDAAFKHAPVLACSNAAAVPAMPGSETQNLPGITNAGYPGSYHDRNEQSSNVAAPMPVSLPPKTASTQLQPRQDIRAVSGLPQDASTVPRPFLPVPYAPTMFPPTISNLTMQQMLMMAAAARSSMSFPVMCAGGEAGVPAAGAGAPLGYPHPMLPTLLMSRMHAYFQHICRLNPALGAQVYVPPIDPDVTLATALPPAADLLIPRDLPVQKPPSSPSKPPAAGPPSVPRPVTGDPECPHPLTEASEAGYPNFATLAMTYPPAQQLPSVDDRPGGQPAPGRREKASAVLPTQVVAAVVPSLAIRVPTASLTPEERMRSPPGGQIDLPKPWTPDPLIPERKLRKPVQALCNVTRAPCPISVCLSETRIGAGVHKKWAPDVDPTLIQLLESPKAVRPRDPAPVRVRAKRPRGRPAARCQ
eukprot:jgi/Botrbrau1/12981/Bobra.384_1s0006.1